MLLWCNVGFAKNTLTMWEDSKIYNKVAKQWNEFAKESGFIKVFKYCDSITPMSPKLWLRISDCWYDEEQRLIKKHKLLITDEMWDLVYKTYQKLFAASKEHSLNATRGYDSWDSYETSVRNLGKSYEKRFANLYLEFARSLEKSANEKTIKKEKDNNKMEAANYCSEQSDKKSKEIRAEYFKFCMEYKGY